MASNAKTIAELLNGDVTVTATDIADDAVTSAKIADDAVTSAKIATGSVIADGLGAGSVTATKLGASAVTNAKIQNDAVTPSKISQNLGRRNMIINGAMQVSQRATTYTWGPNNSGFGSVDRFKFYNQGAGNQEYVVSQETDAPAGFQYSTKVRTNIADASPPAAQYTILRLGLIEFKNTYTGGWGTSDAKPHTLSFWVKSSKTGSQTVAVQRHGNVQRSIYKTLTINSADTWEYKTFLIEADTSGNLVSTETQNNMGITIDMYVNAGSQYKSTSYPQTTWASRSGTPGPGNGLAKDCLDLADTANAYIQITGIQFEVGENATEFEHLPYEEDLRKCQRYYQRFNFVSGQILFNNSVWDTNDAYSGTFLPTEMRANPTFQYPGGSNFEFKIGGTPYTVDYITIHLSSPQFVGMRYHRAGTGWSGGSAVYAQCLNSNAFWAFVAEL